MIRRTLVLLLLAIAVQLLGACIEARHAPALVEAGCVLLRALSTDGRALEVCASADELAPLIPEILEARAHDPTPTGPAPRVATALAEPRRRIPWRRCAVWQEDDPGRRLDGGPRRSSSADHDGGDGGDGGGAHR